MPRLTIDVDGTVLHARPPRAGSFAASTPITGKTPSITPAGTRRPDWSRPAGEESARQCARLQAGRRLPARGDQRPAGGLRPPASNRVPDGRRLLPRATSCGCWPPALWLCHQGRLLARAAPQVVRRRPVAAAARGSPGSRVLPWTCTSPGGISGDPHDALPRTRRP